MFSSVCPVRWSDYLSPPQIQVLTLPGDGTGRRGLGDMPGHEGSALTKRTNALAEGTPQSFLSPYTTKGRDTWQPPPAVSAP